MGAPLLTGLNADAQVEAVVRRGLAFIVNGYDRGQKRFVKDGAVTVQNLGLKPLMLTDDMTLAGTGAGVMTGTYSGSICLYNGLVPILLESNPSPIETVTVAAEQIRFTWNSAAFDTQVTKVRCYLTIAGAASEFDSMYLVAEVAASDDTVDVNLADAVIQAGSSLSTRNTAPQGNYAHICLHKNKIVMANRARSLEASGAANSGSTTTLVDTVLEDWEDDYFQDMYVVVRPGAADEETRQVLTYTPTSGTITFAALSTTVSGSDAYAVYQASGPTEVVWSPADKPEVFPTDNAVSIDNTILDEITCIASFHDRVVAFSRTGAVAIHTETAQVQVLPLDFGCVSSKTWARVGHNALLLSEKGVYRLSPGFGFQNFTDPLLDNFIEDINPAASHKACAAYHGRRYHIAFAGEGETKNNRFYYYDFLSQGWVQREYPFKIQSLASVHDDLGIARLYAGCAGSDPGYRIKLLDIGLNDVASADSVDNEGTATAGTTGSVTDDTQAWTVNEFAGASVRVRRQNSSGFEDSVVQSNTATALTFSPVLSFTPVVGDSYEIGIFDSKFESANMDFGAAHLEKRLLWAHVEIRDEFDANSAFTVGAAKDAEEVPYKSNTPDKDRTFAKIFLAGRGKHHRLVIEDSSPDSPGHVKNVVMAAEVDRGQQ